MNNWEVVSVANEEEAILQIEKLVQQGYQKKIFLY
ncbi:Uncharacterised protein [Listeria fleischmannii subsp. fleischmannii]|uniref:Uncharacterized protein n=1 Tax=Listeria fleischmannii subsp. fleischmannii TaxID=1671902 RepID=A0A2X3GT24_9LIST|nr:Uncharacterised protein [Listeria fleischmannii subsp. fleischmannii]